RPGARRSDRRAHRHRAAAVRRDAALHGARADPGRTDRPGRRRLCPRRRPLSHGDRQLPFANDARPAVAPSPGALVPGLDERWEAAIRRCLEPDPALRFTSAGAVVEAIAPQAPAPRLSGAAYVIGALGLVALAALTGSVWRSHRDRPSPPASPV